MSQVTTITILAALSAFGFTTAAVLPPDGVGDLMPWKEIAGGSSALLMFAAIVVFLKFLHAERTSATKEREDAAREREKLTQTFSDTAANLMREYRDDCRQGREDLHSLLRETKGHR